MAFLTEPEKLINMPKFDISVYPNLMKAVEILDKSNFTPGQQIAYTNHLFAVADINESRMESFDKGYEEIALKYSITVEEVEKLAKEFE